MLYKIIIKRSSVTSTLVVDKSTLQIFKAMFVAYRKIEDLEMDLDRRETKLFVDVSHFI